MTESFSGQAFMFTTDVHTYDLRASDDTVRINPHWFNMQTNEARQFLLDQCNELHRVRRAHLKIAQAQLSAMLSKE